MTWVVVGEQKGRITLVSTRDADGLIHKGSYLTIEDGKSKFILRVEDSVQLAPYSPSPMIVDMDLSPLLQDQKCQNLVFAQRVIDYPEREDGMSSFVKPQMKARRANQEEIDLALGSKEGVPVFPATAFARSVQILRDDAGRFIKANIPEDVFFQQRYEMHLMPRG